jgi:hypothetical protein
MEICKMHICTLCFGTVLKDRLRPLDQSYSIERNPHKRSQVGRDPPYRSSYVMDYEALTEMSIMRVPQQSIWPGVLHA